MSAWRWLVSVVDEVLRVDWEQVRLKRAISGLVSMLLVVAFLGAIGDPALAALLATLFVTAAGGDGAMTDRLPGMIRFTIVGALLGGLAFLSTESSVAVAIVLGIATYVGTLAAAEGPTAAKAGVYLTIWPLFALMLGSSNTEPWTVVAGFLVGGVVAMVATAFRLRVSSEDEAGDIDLPDELDEVPGEHAIFLHRFVAATRSPIGVFAVVRTAAVVLAVVLGYWLFPDYPLWVAITVIVVVKPSASQSLTTAVERTLGTAVGVAIALVVASALPQGDTAVAIAFLISGALMVAFINANYTLFAAFLTAMLVFGQRLAQADAFEAGWERLFATAAGAAIAIAVMAIARSVNRWRPARTNGTHHAEEEST